jgi:hypothetical protein
MRLLQATLERTEKKENKTMSECEWCGSSKHKSDNCPTRNLVRYLNDETLSPEDRLPDVTVTTNEDNLDKTIEEAHFLQHIEQWASNCPPHSAKVNKQ